MYIKPARKEPPCYLHTCRGPVVVAVAVEGRWWRFINSRVVIYRLTGEFHYQRAKNSSSVITGLNWICEPVVPPCLRIKWEISRDAWQEWPRNRSYFTAKCFFFFFFKELVCVCTCARVGGEEGKLVHCSKRGHRLMDGTVWCWPTGRHD